MSIEEELRIELETVARALPSQPVVSVPGLERAGRRERTRVRATLVSVAAAAAVVVAVTGASVLGRGSGPDPAPPGPAPSGPQHGEPATLEDLPVGPSTGVPWRQGGVWHVDGTEIATPLKTVVFRGGTTLVGRSAADGASWSLVRDGQLVPLVESPWPLVPKVSPDGSRIAWVQEEGSHQLGTYRSRVHYRVVAFDVAGQREVGALDRTQLVECCDAGGSLTLLGLNANGRVLFGSMGGDPVLWEPGDGETVLRGREADLLVGDMWPGGITWQEEGGAGIMDVVGAYGTVGTDGTVHRVGTMPDDQLGRWSGDGSAYVYPGTSEGDSPSKVRLDHLWVKRIDAQEPVELRLPSAPSFQVVAWESADVVLIEARQPYGEPGDYEPGLVGLVRCDASSGDCERVADGPTGGATVPDLY
ncbi:MAG: hypothetical protein JWO11_83 [Nocardioides sp.]|nr:hypothetical protein [Nocardioides sp.]